MPNIRPFQPQDLKALYAIALATGPCGRDASWLYENPDMIGDMYAAPYARLAPESVFVFEDAQGVGGYIVGAYDTVVWAARLEHDWWPHLQQSTADGLRPEIPPTAVLTQFPAHIHMNLLPRLQGQGLGVKLLEMWLAAARERGVAGVHVGVDRRNQSAIGFWRKQKFHALEAISDHETLWMGRKLAPKPRPSAPHQTDRSLGFQTRPR